MNRLPDPKTLSTDLLWKSGKKYESDEAKSGEMSFLSGRALFLKQMNKSVQ